MVNIPPIHPSTADPPRIKDPRDQSGVFPPPRIRTQGQSQDIVLTGIVRDAERGLPAAGGSTLPFPTSSSNFSMLSPFFLFGLGHVSLSLSVTADLDLIERIKIIRSWRRFLAFGTFGFCLLCTYNTKARHERYAGGRGMIGAKLLCT